MRITIFLIGLLISAATVLAEHSQPAVLVTGLAVMGVGFVARKQPKRPCTCLWGDAMYGGRIRMDNTDCPRHDAPRVKPGPPPCHECGNDGRPCSVCRRPGRKRCTCKAYNKRAATFYPGCPVHDIHERPQRLPDSILALPLYMRAEAMRARNAYLADHGPLGLLTFLERMDSMPVSEEDAHARYIEGEFTKPWKNDAQSAGIPLDSGSEQY
jgi:hypothetical protein